MVAPRAPHGIDLGELTVNNSVETCVELFGVSDDSLLFVVVFIYVLC